jgi:hypothetical protein
MGNMSKGRFEGSQLPGKPYAEGNWDVRRAGRVPTTNMTRLKALPDSPNAIDLLVASSHLIFENEIVCSDVDSAASTQSKRVNGQSRARNGFTRHTVCPSTAKD